MCWNCIDGPHRLLLLAFNEECKSGVRTVVARGVLAARMQIFRYCRRCTKAKDVGQNVEEEIGLCTEYGRRRMLLGEYENRGGLGCAQFCAQFCAESHSNEGETGGRRAQSASASCACPRKCSMHPAWATTRVELGSLYFPMCVLCTPYCVTVHHELVGEVHVRLSILYSVLCTA